MSAARRRIVFATLVGAAAHGFVQLLLEADAVRGPAPIPMPPVADGS